MATGKQHTSSAELGEVVELDLHSIDAFIQHEADLLDDRRFEDWLALYTDDAYYWVPNRPEQPDPYNELSLFYDTRELMETRVRRLRHPSIHIQTPPSRTCHVISGVRITKGGPSDSEFDVASKFLMLEYRQDNQRLFGGRVRHRLRREKDGLRIAWKKVELINCDSVHSPIALPF